MANRRLSYAGIIGAVVFLSFFLASVFPTVLTNIDPDYLFEERLASPSFAHFLGTDGLGRDLFSLTLYSAKYTILSGICIALFSGVVGIIIGTFTMFVNDIFDSIIVELINMFSIMPTVFLILLFTSAANVGFWGFVLIVSFSFWTGTARIMRTQVKKMLCEPFVEVLLLTGESKIKILVFHIIPNSIRPVIANVALSVANACMLECGLSYINVANGGYSLGGIIRHGQKYLLSSPRIALVPICVIVIISISILLISDAFRNE